MRRKQLRFIVYVADGTIGPDELKREHSSSRKERITHLTRPGNHRMNGTLNPKSKKNVVQRWSPSFDPMKNTQGKTTIWVRVPNLPIHCYNEEF